MFGLDFKMPVKTPAFHIGVPGFSMPGVNFLIMEEAEVMAQIIELLTPRSRPKLSFSILVVLGICGVNH